MTEFVNLTPHRVDIVLEDSSVISVQPSLDVARVKEEFVSVDPLETVYGPVPVARYQYEDCVNNLPAPAKGVVYIVSARTAHAVPDRSDVFVPGDKIRDLDGNVIACTNLFTMADPERARARKRIMLYLRRIATECDGEAASLASQALRYVDLL